MQFDVTLTDIQAAAARLAGRIRRTPTFHSAGLSARLGVETWVKVESLQLGGSFKVRGCFNKLMALSEESRISPGRRSGAVRSRVAMISWPLGEGICPSSRAAR